MSPPRLRASPVACLLLCLAALAAPAGAQDASTAADVLGYHNTPDRAGLYVAPGLTWARARAVHRDARFNASFTGNVYAQPLYWQPKKSAPGMLIVATELNLVYALDAATGAELWHRKLGPETPLGDLQCGNIDPSGVTGAPAIDAATATLYVDGMIKTGTGPRHRVFALSLDDGKILNGWPVDVATGLAAFGQAFDATAQGQRGALAFVGGKLFVPFAGINGDCGTYFGIAVGIVPGVSPKIAHVWATRVRGGGVWGQDGIAFDGTAMFFTTGNTFTSPSTPWGGGEAVIRVGADLAHSNNGADYFTPTNWQQLDNEDADLGGTGPLPIDVPAAGGKTLPRILQLGKDGNAYLLDRDNLGGIGGQIAVAHVSTGAIRTGPATFRWDGTTVVAFEGTGADCPSGQSGNMVALQLTHRDKTEIATLWCNALPGAGAPIVTTSDGSSDPIVWAVGAEGDDRLHAYRGSDGTVLFGGGGANDQMAGLHHMQTLIFAAGRLYVAGDNKVFAFKY